MSPNYTHTQYEQARLSKDARFDGKFYIAVKTTGIFCRPICPAPAPKEENVEYFATAAQALAQGFRPCLRCRPESAPGSWAWLGVQASVERALKLIDQGVLQGSSVAELAERLGITERYLHKLFITHVGMSPKKYAQSIQIMFAKQLLHSSSLSISDIAFASGFGSVRRFNDAFVKALRLSPSQIRKQQLATQSPTRHVMLAVRAPFNWQHMLAFYRMRAVESIEQIGEDFYQRTVRLEDCQGWFRASMANPTLMKIEFELSDISKLRVLVNKIRRLFDLDADSLQIEAHLKSTPLGSLVTPGIRIPGVWSPWEAGVRAIIGQQITVKAAITQLNRLVANSCGDPTEGALRFFPTPAELLKLDPGCLKMPEARKQTLMHLAEFVLANGDEAPQQWLQIKGIGPWTVSYANLRGCSAADCFLNSDLVVKKVLQQLPEFDLNTLSPWGSYATFHCWNSTL